MEINSGEREADRVSQIIDHLAGTSTGRNPVLRMSNVTRDGKTVNPPELRKKYPSLRELPSVRTRVRLAPMTGNVSETSIQRFVEPRKGL